VHHRCSQEFFNMFIQHVQSVPKLIYSNAFALVLVLKYKCPTFFVLRCIKYIEHKIEIDKTRHFIKFEFLIILFCFLSNHFIGKSNRLLEMPCRNYLTSPVYVKDIRPTDLTDVQCLWVNFYTEPECPMSPCLVQNPSFTCKYTIFYKCVNECD
jgi:hypothetical protein